MKRLFLLCAILPLFLNAQDPAPELLWGENLRDEDMSFDKFLGKSENSIYVLTNHGKEHALLEFNSSNLSLINSTVLPEMDYHNDSYLVKSTLKVKSGMRYFWAEPAEDRGFWNLYHQQLKFDGSLTDKKLVEVLSMQQFALIMSEDESKFVLRTWTKVDGGKTTSNLKVLDENLDRLFEADVVAPFEGDGEYVPINMRVSNIGEVYFLGYRKDTKERNLANASITEKYAVMRFDHRGANHILDLATYEKEIHDLSLEVDFNGKIILSGLYFTDRKAYKSSSLYMVLSETDLKPEKVTYSDFSEEFLKNFDFNPKTKESYKFSPLTGRRKSTLKGLLRVKFKDFLSWPDGSFTVVGEREHDINPNANYYYTHRDELVVIKFDAIGNVVWANTIDKHQEEYSKYSPYTVHQTEDEVHILFNDDSRNMKNRAEGKEPMRFDAVGNKQKVHTLDAIVNDKGEISLHEIATYKGRRVLFTYHYLYWNDDTAFIFFRPDYLGGEHIVKIKF